ncbi:MAG TPA: hypothetical protein VHX43_12545 [Xanthobacteraceae bacterium]|nr:hypothetical protein [Xanthobacteraceae bacterium]
MEPHAYIYVSADGTARELHPGERAYLETEFNGGDGAMPSVKESYEERNGWGELSGYLARAALPPGTPVGNAPAEGPRRPMSREDTIAWLRGKGVEVTENSDGSLTVRGRVR